MAKLNWIIFCKKAVVDSDDNNISLHSLLSEIHPLVENESDLVDVGGKQPMIPLESSLAICLTRDDRNKPEATEDLQIELLDPKGKSRLKTVMTADLRKHAQARLIAKVPGVPASPEGYYRWIVRRKSGRSMKTIGAVEYVLKYARSKPEMEAISMKARESATLRVKAGRRKK